MDARPLMSIGVPHRIRICDLLLRRGNCKMSQLRQALLARETQLKQARKTAHFSKSKPAIIHVIRHNEPIMV